METEHMTNERLLLTLEMSGYVERHTIARTLELLMEVEKRKLDLELSYSSMYDFCVRHLRFSENEAYRRLACARLVAKFPMMLEPLRVGSVTLTNLVLLHKLFTPENVDALLEEIAWKTKREVEVIVARLKPRPDVPDSITLLTVQAPLVAPPPPVAAPAGGMPPTAHSPALERETSHPLSEDRYAFSFTGSGTFLEKLEKAGGLTHHRPVGDGLAAIFELALDALIASREKRKFGKTERPRKAKPSKDPSYISAATRRDVAARDEMQCTYVSADGRRCSARERLELDHRHPRARGGAGDTSNVRILCSVHNRHEAEKAFGREHIEYRIRTAQAKRRATVGNEAALPPSATTPRTTTPTEAVTGAKPLGEIAAMVEVASDETAAAPHALTTQATRVPSAADADGADDDTRKHARLRYALVKDLGFKGCTRSAARRDLAWAPGRLGKVLGGAETARASSVALVPPPAPTVRAWRQLACGQLLRGPTDRDVRNTPRPLRAGLVKLRKKSKALSRAKLDSRRHQRARVGRASA